MFFSQAAGGLSFWLVVSVCVSAREDSGGAFFSFSLLLGGLLMARELVEGADWRMVGARRSALI